MKRLGDTLILRRPKQTSVCTSGIVRVSAETYDLLVAISSEVGRPISYVATEMIKFAAEHTKIEEE